VTARAYSFLQIKSVDEERREILGWASRPEPDRVGDVVESLGMQPPRGTVNLLLDHNHSRSVGTVSELKPSADGVRFKAKIAKIAQPGALKELCDDAWEMVKSGLRAATSIGFRPLEMEPMPNGGMRYRKWEILELSLVSVPCAPGATIDSIKSFDRELIRKAGKSRVVRLDEPLINRKTGEVLWQPPKRHRVVKLGGQTATTAQCGSIIGAAEAAMEELFEAQKLANLAKKAGPSALPIRMLSEAARATDTELGAIRARLAKLEGGKR